jgi:hypothetical protein
LGHVLKHCQSTAAPDNLSLTDLIGRQNCAAQIAIGELGAINVGGNSQAATPYGKLRKIRLFEIAKSKFGF